MNTCKKMIIVVSLLAVSVLPVTAQEIPLQYFPEDAVMILRVDLQRMMALMPDQTRADIRKESLENLGFDMTQQMDYIAMALTSDMMSGGGQPEDFYMLIKAGISLDQIRSAASSAGKSIVPVQVGSITAYRAIDEDDDNEGLMAEVSPGLLLFASGEKGIQRFQQVTSGSASAKNNAKLTTALSASRKGSLLVVAGVFTDQMKMLSPQMAGLDTYTVDVNFDGNMLGVQVVLSANDPAALQMLDMMMTQTLSMQSQMFTSMDPTGAIQEVIDNLKSNISGNKLIISTGISKAKLDSMIATYSGMFGLPGADDGN